MKALGFSEKQFAILKQILQKVLPEKSIVIIYGSRAKGNYTERSDIDLVLKNSYLTRHQLQDLITDLEESDLPWLCDVQQWEDLQNIALKEHIKRQGKIIFKK